MPPLTVARLVPVKNQIRYDTSVRQPEMTRGADATELPADRPLVRLQPNGGAALLLVTSSSTKMIRRYQLLVALGDLRVNAWLHPLEFIIIGALSDWQSVLMRLTWKGDQFIKALHVKDIPEGRNTVDAAKGMHTWAALFSLDVEMWFTSSKLKGLKVADIPIGGR